MKFGIALVVARAFLFSGEAYAQTAVLADLDTDASAGQGVSDAGDFNNDGILDGVLEAQAQILMELEMRGAITLASVQPLPLPL